MTHSEIMKNLWKNKEYRKMMVKSHIGKYPSEITKEKMSLIRKCKKLSEETKKRMKENHKISDEGRKKLSEFMKKNNPMYNKESLKKMTESIKKKFKEDKNYKNKVRINALKGLLKRPTSFEQKISDLCFKYNLPFIYKGNGDFWINCKNPDFVNYSKKILIEVFYSWFKIRDYGSVENYKKFCKKKYNSAGWKVIFIDELDLNNKNWEKICLNKIESNIDYKEIDAGR